MARWRSGSRERLQGAALELFAERGFDRTTVEQIAERAELTERTFYRQFADKREVLFDGQETFVATFVDGLEAVPAGASPATLVASVLDAAAGFFPPERRAWSRARQSVIESEPALRERELLKLASLSHTLAEAFAARGLSRPQSRLCADTVLSIFQIAFSRWLATDAGPDIADLMRETLAELRELAITG